MKKIIILAGNGLLPKLIIEECKLRKNFLSHTVFFMSKVFEKRITVVKSYIWKCLN